MLVTHGKSRDARGRFIPGHDVVSPGRPCRVVEKEFLAAFHRGCPPSELEAVTAKLVELALAGDVNAARLLLSHALPLSARVELMTEPPTEPYRVAGQRASQTNNEMAKRLMASIKRTRERDAATRK
jgi:hypothetical protein